MAIFFLDTSINAYFHKYFCPYALNLQEFVLLRLFVYAMFVNAMRCGYTVCINKAVNLPVSFKSKQGNQDSSVNQKKAIQGQRPNMENKHKNIKIIKNDNMVSVVLTTFCR